MSEKRTKTRLLSAGKIRLLSAGLLLLNCLEAHAAIKAGSFSCSGMAAGYYADMSGGCEGYYMCAKHSSQGLRFSCPPGTKFQQQSLVCDHGHQVECSASPQYFHYNRRIGLPHRHFIDDLKEADKSFQNGEKAHPFSTNLEQRHVEQHHENRLQVLDTDFEDHQRINKIQDQEDLFNEVAGTNHNFRKKSIMKTSKKSEESRFPKANLFPPNRVNSSTISVNAPNNSGNVPNSSDKSSTNSVNGPHNSGNCPNSSVKCSKNSVNDPNSSVNGPNNRASGPNNSPNVPPSSFRSLTGSVNGQTSSVQSPTPRFKIQQKNFQSPKTNAKVPLNSVKIQPSSVRIPTNSVKIPTSRAKGSTSSVKGSTSSAKGSTRSDQIPTSSAKGSTSSVKGSTSVISPTSGVKIQPSVQSLNKPGEPAYNNAYNAGFDATLWQTSRYHSASNLVEENISPPQFKAKLNSASKRKEKEKLAIPPTFLTPPTNIFRKYQVEKKVTTKAITYNTRDSPQRSKYNIVFKIQNEDSIKEKNHKSGKLNTKTSKSIKSVKELSRKEKEEKKKQHYSIKDIGFSQKLEAPPKNAKISYFSSIGNNISHTDNFGFSRGPKKVSEIRKNKSVKNREKERTQSRAISPAHENAIISGKTKFPSPGDLVVKPRGPSKGFFNRHKLEMFPFFSRPSSTPAPVPALQFGFLPIEDELTNEIPNKPRTQRQQDSKQYHQHKALQSHNFKKKIASISPLDSLQAPLPSSASSSFPSSSLERSFSPRRQQKSILDFLGIFDTRQFFYIPTERSDNSDEGILNIIAKVINGDFYV